MTGTCGRLPEESITRARFSGERGAGRDELRNWRRFASATARGRGPMAYWLMKSEPHVYSSADLVRDGATDWDGVRNNAARLHLRAMRPGDEAFFYHSGD